MKFYIYYPLLIIALVGCTKNPPATLHLAQQSPGVILTADNAPEHLSQDFNIFQLLLAETLTSREQTLSFHNQVQKKIDQELPLSGADLDTLNKGLAKHLHIREELYQAAHKYKNWLDQAPQGLEPALRLQGITLSLAAALALYDNYLVAFSLFQENEKLRRYINARHPGYEINALSLTKITAQYNSLAKRQQVRQAIVYFQSHIQAQPPSFHDKNAYFLNFITSSPSYNSTLKVSPFYILNRYGQFLSGVTNDTLAKTRDDGINLFSLLFGNTVGLVQTRTGYLHNDPKVRDTLSSQLRAGDILLEKTPFRLTDKLIPGYWGHVAIWLGSEQELIDLGIWDHPAVIPYHHYIRSERQIVEALRAGVTANTLAHFINVDDLAILRQTDLANETLAQILIRAFRQIGKQYDFNFDIESNDRIVCSELIYITYANINWPTQKKLGRFTISPSQIAEKVGPEKPFSIVSLYLQGKAITDDKNQKFLQLL